MNKEQIKLAIQEGLKSGEITAGDIQSLLLSTKISTKERTSTLSKVLYSLGGIIAIIGVVSFVSDNWTNLGTAGRLIVTFGFSLLTYCTAIVLYKKNVQSALVQLFFVLSALIAAPAGFTLLDSFGAVDATSVYNQIGIALVLTVLYAYALYLTRKNVLHIITGVFFSWAYYATVGSLIKNSGYSGDLIRDIAVYTSMILGFAFLAYSSWLKTSLSKNFALNLKRVASFYGGIAFFFVLIPALFLTGFWDVLYPLLALAAVVLSINIRASSGLVISAVSVGFYVIHMSSKYFADSIGWAITLVIIGFLIIALGYLTYYLNKKYISKA